MTEPPLQFPGTDNEWLELQHTIVKAKPGNDGFVTVKCPYCKWTNKHDANRRLLCGNRDGHRMCDGPEESGRHYDCPGYILVVE